MLKVGVQSGDWYDNDRPLESLEYIKECGFEAIDFNIDNYLDTQRLAKEGVHETFFDQPIEDILKFFEPLKEATEKTGIIISQMHAPFPIWFEGLDDVNEYITMALDKCFAVCEYVGCPAIVVHPSRNPDRRVEFELNAGIYRKLIPIIKKYKGVKICTENIFTHQGIRIIEGRLSNPDDACALVDLLNEEAGGEYFGFCLDIGHANLTKNKIGEFVKSLGKRLTILHIHDNDGNEDIHMVPYSYLSADRKTVIDWDGFVKSLREIGYDGTLSFETFRICHVYPKAVHTSVLRLIADIGHYWKKEIEK